MKSSVNASIIQHIEPVQNLPVIVDNSQNNVGKNSPIITITIPKDNFYTEIAIPTQQISDVQPLLPQPSLQELSQQEELSQQQEKLPQEQEKLPQKQEELPQKLAESASSQTVQEELPKEAKR